DNYGKPKATRVRLMLSQTDRAIIEWLHIKLGGTIYSKASSGNHKASYTWTLNGQRATLLLMAIRPYLKVKEERADVAIAFGKIRLGRVSTGITNDERSQLSKLKQKLLVLNQRGNG
ncbi:unnamed protein product, partial [marine sediment metagenome]